MEDELLPIFPAEKWKVVEKSYGVPFGVLMYSSFSNLLSFRVASGQFKPLPNLFRIDKSRILRGFPEVVTVGLTLVWEVSAKLSSLKITLA